MSSNSDKTTAAAAAPTDDGIHKYILFSSFRVTCRIISCMHLLHFPELKKPKCYGYSELNDPYPLSWDWWIGQSSSAHCFQCSSTFNVCRYAPIWHFFPLIVFFLLTGSISFGWSKLKQSCFYYLLEQTMAARGPGGSSVCREQNTHRFPPRHQMSFPTFLLRLSLPLVS